MWGFQLRKLLVNFIVLSCALTDCDCRGSLDQGGQSRAEAVYYKGISAAETQQLLALLLDWSLPTAASGRSGSSSATPDQQQQQQQGTPPSAAALQLAAEACQRTLGQQLLHSG